MRKCYYEVVFMATETLQNGKESRHKFYVYVPRFQSNGRHTPPEVQIDEGIKMLKDKHIYDIEHITNSVSNIMVADI